MEVIDEIPENAQVQAGHELIFYEPGTVIDLKDSTIKKSGFIMVLQAPKDKSVQEINDSTDVYGYLSINELNLPLHPTATSFRKDEYTFIVRLPRHEFVIEFQDGVEKTSLAQFKKILEWFTGFEKKLTAAEFFDEAGEKGKEKLEEISGAVLNKIDQVLQPHVEAARENETNEIGLGGGTTRSVLSKIRDFIGGVASFGSSAIDRASDSVGSALSRILRKTDKNYAFHDTLSSGMVAIGKIYVTFDEQGQSIISTAGDRSSEILRERYGEEVSAAARDVTSITRDGYKIFRFPVKFPVQVLVRGAQKASEENATLS